MNFENLHFIDIVVSSGANTPNKPNTRDRGRLCSIVDIADKKILQIAN